MPEVIHVFSEQDSKGSLLAEVHRLQSSLAAMRQARDFHGANSAERMRQVDRLQEQVWVLREVIGAIIARVALVSPYYEQARAALAATEPKP